MKMRSVLIAAAAVSVATASVHNTPSMVDTSGGYWSGTALFVLAVRNPIMLVVGVLLLMVMLVRLATTISRLPCSNHVRNSLICGWQPYVSLFCARSLLAGRLMATFFVVIVIQVRVGYFRRSFPSGDRVHGGWRNTRERDCAQQADDPQQAIQLANLKHQTYGPGEQLATVEAVEEGMKEICVALK